MASIRSIPRKEERTRIDCGQSQQEHGPRIYESQQDFEALVHRAIEGIVLHQDLVIQYANPAAARIFGFDRPADMIGRPVIETLVAPEDRGRLLQRYDSLVEGNLLPNEFGWKANRPDGRKVLVQSNGTLTSWNGRSAVLGFYVDVTEQIETRESLRQSRERLEILSRQLIATQESERRHLARELHDEIGQALTAIKLNLMRLTSPGNDVTQSHIVSETVSLVDQTIRQSRDLALQLRPPMLDDLGLEAALHWSLVRAAEQVGLSTSFESDLGVTGLAPEIATACFRVAQESLTNIVRHAHARHVSLTLRRLDTTLEMRIHDNGRGFDVSTAKKRATRGESFGLLGMSERIQLLGGHLDIISTPSTGTTVCVCLPGIEPRAPLDSP